MATEPAVIAEGPTPSEEPEVTPDVTAADAEPAAADGQAVQDASSEPTSEVAAAAPPDIFDLTDPDVAFIVEKYGNDPNALARELHAANNRNAEQARAREAQPEPPREQESQAAQRSVELPADVEQAVWRSVREDQECVALKEDYGEIVAQIAEIAVLNRRGDLVGGELLTVDQGLRKLDQDYLETKRLLTDVGRIKLDEYQKSEAKEALQQIKEEREELREKRAALVDRYGTLRSAKQARSDKYQQRYDAYRNHFSKQIQTTRAKQEEDRVITGIQTEFTKEWNVGLAAAFKSLNIPNDPELRQALTDRALQAGKLTVITKPIPTGGSRAFIEDVFKREMKTAEYWKRQGVGTYAGQKRRDVLPQAPSGRASVAPADPANSTDWKERWRAKADEFKERFGSPSANDVFKNATGRPTV